jgi:transcriptional regulator with XRE-family HTH domain
MNLFYELIRDDAGLRIKYERKAWGMSRKKLARLSYTDPETIEYIEKGYVCMMDFRMLMNISKALQVSPFIFFRKTLTNEEIIELSLDL